MERGESADRIRRERTGLASGPYTHLPPRKERDLPVLLSVIYYYSDAFTTLLLLFCEALVLVLICNSFGFWGILDFRIAGSRV